MSESNPTPANDTPENGAPPGMPLAVNLQYTRDLSFEVPAGAAIFKTLRGAPQVGVNIDVRVDPIEENQPIFEVSLVVRVEATEPPEQEGGQNGRTVFIADLTYAAIVTLNNAPQEIVEPLLLVEVPRLIFPFARNIISDVTRDGGFPSVVLAPIDFVALWQAKRAAQFPEPAGHA
ncbi:preprotein translocase subunit SecB [Neoasaia chiangmaiensis NBRC 101099]|uniref:Protein-export protein SecB n=1 Tax=Neoasaia chiangmaiensis TaxID=320497 RepID=A0A1U9KMX7_9PROT|nr:protein-export chaperone SecB [Neoasaia chiangmaiensis]AQS87147.1 protein-export chaperone SecB [Neoasaia chiangmaiensis]GBR38166.1 preprotein translocase subunit SecB [Neoasaia chiangmaiensis NBRC 101099]GEN16009.1 protein-export protein SecB [Neoasaia chiangmaiensis]